MRNLETAWQSSKTGKIEDLNEAQENALYKIMEDVDNGKKKGLLSLPPGVGKTILSAFVGKNTDCRILFIAHTNELLTQSRDAYSEIIKGRKFSILNGESKEYGGDIIFASIQTLSRPKHLLKFKEDEFDIIIIDEAHHSIASTYRKVIEYFKPKYLLGMTATPFRLDDPAEKTDVGECGERLFELYDKNIPYYENREDAITKAILVPFTYFLEKHNINFPFECEDTAHKDNDLNRRLFFREFDRAVLEKYMEKGLYGKKTIGFCTSIYHANRMSDFFNKSGITSAAITSKTRKEKRKDIFEKFKNNGIQCIFTVNVFNEGIDVPSCEALLMLRPTISRTVWEQQIGRGLRHFPNKSHVDIIDFVDNWNKEFLYQFIKQHKATKDGDKWVIHEHSLGYKIVLSEKVMEYYRSLERLERRKAYIESLSVDEIKAKIKKASPNGTYVRQKVLCMLMGISQNGLKSIMAKNKIRYSSLFI